MDLAMMTQHLAPLVVALQTRLGVAIVVLPDLLVVPTVTTKWDWARRSCPLAGSQGPGLAP
jgi:hypothetical protein